MPLMTKDELIERLKQYEWNDVEFKLCKNSVSKDVYKTVSAFSNTEGGHLIFGISDDGGKFDIVGVAKVNEVESAFISCLNSEDKLSKRIEYKEAVLEEDGKTLLIFYIPEAPRRNKPIYLNGDITQSYKRSGGGDYKCDAREIERFLRDASDTSFDNQPLLEYNADDFYDDSTVRAYRRYYTERNQSSIDDLSDLEFLKELGFVVESNDKLVPNRAGLLLFGKSRHILREVPRGIVDFFKINSNSEDWTPEKRWFDRLCIEDNLLNAWMVLRDKFVSTSDIPFVLDSSDQMRKDQPHDFVTFREAAINLLIHQDYGDLYRTPVIRLFKDRLSFWNPGDASATIDQLLEGSGKELRNPVIVRAFRQIGLSERAGGGIRTILRECRDLGYTPAQITNNKTDNSFSLDIFKQNLITEKQLIFQSQIGVRLNDNEASVFALICQKPLITILDVKSAILTDNSDSLKVIDELLTQRLIEPVAEGYSWKLAEHFSAEQEPDKTEPAYHEETDQATIKVDSLVTDQALDKVDDLVTDQVPPQPVIPSLTELSDHQKKTLLFCEIPRKLSDIMSELGLAHKSFYRNKHLIPLLEANLIAMSYPKQPNHPEQTYTITDSGLELLIQLQELEERNQTDDETNNH